MPTVHQERGFNFMIYTADHEPAHVHALKSGGLAKINILTGELLQVRGMKFQEVKLALSIVQENREKLLAAWTRIHGE